jgi:hypothetical protein
MKKCLFLCFCVAVPMELHAQDAVANFDFDVIGNTQNRLHPGETASIIVIAEARVPGTLEFKIKPAPPPFSFGWDSRQADCEMTCTLRDTLILSPSIEHGGLYSFTITFEFTDAGGFQSRSRKVAIEVAPELKPEPPFSMGASNEICWFPFGAISSETFFFPTLSAKGQTLNQLTSSSDCQVIENLEDGVRYGYFLRSTFLRDGEFLTLMSDTVYSTQDHLPPPSPALNDFVVDAAGNVTLRWRQPADAVGYVDNYILYRKPAVASDFVVIDSLPVFPVSDISPQNYFPVRASTDRSIYLDQDVKLLNVSRVIEGSAMIQTAQRDAWIETDGFLTFRLTRPSTVYIAYDKRTVKPKWLEDSFRSTRIDVRTTKNPESLLRLWESREVYQPGVVSLGGNFAEVRGFPFDAPDMCVVFIQPIDTSLPYALDGLVNYTDALGIENDLQSFQYRIDAVDAAGNVSNGQDSPIVILDLAGRCRPNITGWFGFENSPGERFGKGTTNTICIQDPGTQAECSGFRGTDSLRFQAARGNSDLFEVHRPEDGGTIFFDSGWLAIHDLPKPFCYSFNLLPAGRDANFVNGQNYHYRVQAKDVHGNLSAWSDTVSAIQDAFPPEDIRNLQAVQQFFPGNENGCISLSWQAAVDPISGVGLYYVYRSNDGVSFSLIDSTLAHETSYCDSLSRIGANRVVHYKVTAADRVGNLRRLDDSDQSISLRGLVGPRIEFSDSGIIECPPGSQAVKKDSVSMRWLDFDNTGVAKYEVEITDAAGQKSTIEATPVATGADVPLAGGDGSYTLRVRAIYGDGRFTIYSNTLRIRKKTALQSVRQLEAANDPQPTGDIIRSWLHPDGNEITEFQIFHWVEGQTQPVQPTVVLPGDSLQWVHGLVSGSLVAYRCNYYLVKALDCLGLVSQTDTVVTQYSNRPPVFDPSQTVIENDDIVVCWQRPAPRAKEDDTFEAEVTVFRDSMNTPPILQQVVFDRNCFSFFGADPKHNYIFQVREIILDNLGQACADAFVSGLSAPLIVPHKNPPPAVAFEVQALPVPPNATTGDVFLSWFGYSGINIDRFQINWSVDGESARDSLTVSRADTARVRGLDIAQIYHFSVFAIDNLDQISEVSQPQTISFRPRWLFTPQIEKFTPTCFRDSVSIQWRWVDEDGNEVSDNFGADSITVELSIDADFEFRKSTTTLDLRMSFLFYRNVHYPFVNNQNNQLYARIRAKDRWNHVSPWSTEYLELGGLAETYDDIPPGTTAIFVDSTKAPIFGGAQQLNVYLHWNEAPDNCSGVWFYEIERDGVVIGRDTSRASVHQFVDRRLKAEDVLSMNWSVHAIDSAGNRQITASSAQVPFVLPPPSSAGCANDTSLCWSPVEPEFGGPVTYFIEGARFVELFGNPETNVLAGPLTETCINFDVPWETIYWRVKTRLSNFESAWSDTFFCALIPQATSILTKNQQSLSLPVEFALGQNYPNPFNPQTTIVYAVPVYDNGLSDSRGVLLEVYNVAGQKIRTLVDEEQRPGEYSITWDGRDDSGMPVGSGVFIYRMRANPFIATRKMIFLK